jgi:hypothetical protein
MRVELEQQQAAASLRVNNPEAADALDRIADYLEHRTPEELRESEERFRSVADTIAAARRKQEAATRPSRLKAELKQVVNNYKGQARRKAGAQAIARHICEAYGYPYSDRCAGNVKDWIGKHGSIAVRDIAYQMLHECDPNVRNPFAIMRTRLREFAA